MFDYHSSNSAGGEGAEVIYALRDTNTLPDLILAEIATEGQDIRKSYQRRLPSDPSKDYYFMQRNTGITQPITVEYGFLDTPADATKLKNNYLDYAEAAVRGVLDYIGFEDETSNQGNKYVVKSGDSLYSIAKKFNISIEELKAANNLNSNLLNINQVLTIPSVTTNPEPGNYTIYTVKSGDSLYKIANDNDISVDEIIDYNNLSSTNLNIGQKILIPNKSTQSNTTTYTVKSGDSLYSIANKYNTTVNEIMNLNNLSSNILSIGQKILIPNKSIQSNTTTYTVKSGDSLYKIANEYGISVNELKQYNNLNSNLLNTGQVLKIPRQSDNITYIVKSGDSLYSIANRYNTTIDQLKRKNNLSSNLLNIGQILLI